ncbi:MBL fold metallo-hydrolase [Candidatus Nomurabacteria bacterium]|nr:MBL fold metallo-hydrolase [Candidatus Nomurabacteria bacterium]
MKITKLVHSCLLIEKDGKKILVDPGVYSWQNEAVKNINFSGLASVVVTHNHPDHLNDEFVAAVKMVSPDAKWYGPGQVVEQLKGIGIEASTSSQEEHVKFVESEHADLSPWYGEQPDHISFLLFGEVLISGDCQTLKSAHGARILASAINGGPWGAVVGFCKMIESMNERPKVVLPLHDWHWNDEARAAIYSKLPEVMGQFDVTFIPLQTCEPQEV